MKSFRHRHQGFGFLLRQSKVRQFQWSCHRSHHPSEIPGVSSFVVSQTVHDSGQNRGAGTVWGGQNPAKIWDGIFSGDLTAFFGEMFFFHLPYNPNKPRLGHLPADIQPCILGTADVHKDAVPEIREGTHGRNGEKNLENGNDSGRLQPVLKNMCHKTGICPKYPQRT